MQASEGTLDEFFQLNWGTDTKGVVYLPTRSKEGAWNKVCFKWPEHRHAIVEYVANRTAGGHEVYFAPALFSEAILRGGPANKSNVIGSRVLWADFDGSAGTPPPQDWIADNLDGIPEPSFRVTTSESTNQHCYWLLDEFCTDLDWIESKNRAIAYTAKADTGCWNIGRLLRPPESINFGYAKPERGGTAYDVVFSKKTNSVFTQESFAKAQHVRLLVNQALVLSEIVPMEQLMMDLHWTAYMQKLMQAPVDEIDDRSGAILSMAMEAAEVGWSDTQIYSMVLAVDDKLRKYVERKDREHLLTDIVERARRKHPVGTHDLMFNGLRGANQPQLAPQEIYTFGDFRKLEIHIDWLLKGLISLDGYGIVFGPSGIGKTQWCLQLAKSIACAQNFLGWEYALDTPCRTLFVSLEMAAAPLHFIATQDSLADPLVDENLLVFPSGEGIALDKPWGKKGFETMLETYQPQVVIIDSYATMIEGALNEDAPHRTLNRYLQSIRNRYHVAIIIVHHSNKSNTGPDLELGDLFGSSYIHTGADFVIGLGYSDPKDILNQLLQVNWCKGRLSLGRKSFWIQRQPGLTFTEWKAESKNASSKPRSDPGSDSGTAKSFLGF